MPLRHSTACLTAVVALATSLLSAGSAAQRDKGRAGLASMTPAEFFSATKVWDAHLTVSAEAWAAMQPRYGAAGGGSRFLGPEGGRNGVAARQGIEFDYVHATLTLGDWTFRDIAVRYKGNGSFLRATREGSDKISLKVDLNKYVKGQKLAGLTTLNFQNNITDAGWMNEVLAYRLYRDAGSLAPRTTYAEVHLTVEGQGTHFLGLYSVSENVDEAFFEERFGTRKGAILKPSTQELFTDWGPDWDVYDQSYDPKTDLTDAQKARIIALGRLVSGASDEEFAARIGEFVDLDAFARYFAVLVWLGNHDSLLQNGQNFYTWLHPETNRMHFIAWDQDFSFGNNRASATARGIDPTRWPIEHPWTSSNRFLARVYAVDAFRTRYLARLAELSERLFLPERFAAQVSELAPAIRPSVERESRVLLPGFDWNFQGGRGKSSDMTRAIACILAVLLAPPALAQRASRPADDWVSVLESPERVAGLRIPEVVAAMKLRPGDVVADLGAGSGLFVVPLSKAVGPKGRVLAVEIDRNFFPHILQKAKAAGVTNIQTIAGDPTDPKLPEPVDIALLHDVLHHIENHAAYIKSLAKYLEPTARIVIVDYLAKQGPHRDDPSLQVGKDEAAKLLAAIGFRPVEDVALFPDKYFVMYGR